MSWGKDWGSKRGKTYRACDSGTLPIDKEVFQYFEIKMDA